MKIVILGATGKTGQHLVTQALERGHDVLALVRNPSKLKLTHENLQVVEANIFDKEKLQEQMQGYDVVMSCLGASPSFSRLTLYSDSIKPIVEATREANISRLVILTSWYAKKTPEESKVFTYIVRKLILGRVLDDMDRMEQYIQENCQDLDYTVIRPPSLTDASLADKEIVAVDGYFVPNGTRIPRANVAKYMLDTSTTDTQLHVKQMVAISIRTDKMDK